MIEIRPKDWSMEFFMEWVQTDLLNSLNAAQMKQRRKSEALKILSLQSPLGLTRQFHFARKKGEYVIHLSSSMLMVLKLLLCFIYTLMNFLHLPQLCFTGWSTDWSATLGLAFVFRILKICLRFLSSSFQCFDRVMFSFVMSSSFYVFGLNTVHVFL